MASAFAQLLGRQKSNAASPVVTNAGAATTVGNHLIAMIATGGSQLTALTVTDPAGNTWQNDSGLGLFDATNNRGIIFLSCKITGSLANGGTLTFNVTGGTNYSVTVIEVSGLDPTTWFSAISAMAGPTTSVNPVSAAVTCAAGDFGAGIICYKVAPPVATPGAGWTEQTDDNIGTIAASAYEANYQANLAAGTAADSATLGSSVAWTCVTAVYKAAVTGGAPTNTVAPAVTGTTQVGQVLTCSQGTWTNTPTSYAYQWKRNGANIGAGANTYTLVDLDDGQAILCVVTATNGSGSNPANSNTVTPTEPLPTNSVAPSITGTAVVGSVLTRVAGTWTHMAGAGGSSLGYQWRRNGTPIGGATGTTYTLVDADDQAVITVAETATNTGGGASTTSGGTASITEPAPTNSVAPVVAGTPRVGSPLTCSTGTWTHMAGSSGSFTYQWQSSPDGVTGWANIGGAVSASYTPVSGDLGRYLLCNVSAHNSGSP